jgi:hypothetical protein
MNRGSKSLFPTRAAAEEAGVMREEVRCIPGTRSRLRPSRRHALPDQAARFPAPTSQLRVERGRVHCAPGFRARLDTRAQPGPRCDGDLSYASKVASALPTVIVHRPSSMLLFLSRLAQCQLFSLHGSLSHALGCGDALGALVTYQLSTGRLARA